MRSTTLVFLTLALAITNQLAAQNETEPNNAFAQANTFTTTGISGNVGTGLDANDYFYFVPAQSGKMKIYLLYNNPAPSIGPDFWLYAYAKNQSLIGTRTLINAPLGTHNDSLILFCREADTIFVRINGTATLTYTLSYAVVSTGTNDVEPNNNFAQATFRGYGTTTNGRISYSSALRDGDDYYKIYIPDNGRFRLFTTYTNTGANNATDFFLNVYNKAQGVIGSKNLINRPVGLNPTDTLTVFCREADTMYVRISADDGCISYAFTYDVVTTGTNDVEPNNTFAQATFKAYGTTTNGRISHTGTVRDGDDYYKIYIPDNGRFRLFTTYTNTGATGGTDFFLNVYNKAQGVIGSKSLINRPVGLGPTDTLTIFCREADTMYVRITADDGCISYAFSYDVVTTGTNDVEPNNNFAQSTFVAMGTPANGRISHTGTVRDGDDYYKIYIPDNGRFRLFTTYTNTGANNATDFYLNVYNKAQGVIGNKNLINRPVGLNPTDTLTVFCREADTMYVRISADDGCISYTISYDVVTTGTNDVEPNNTFAQATFQAYGTTTNGRISHTGTVRDGDDYYKIYIPDNGRFRLFTTYTNTGATGGTDFFLNVYNKAQGLIGSKSLINRPVGLGPTDTLTVFCREADTMFVRITADDGCISYAFSYDVVTTGTNDVEPNNTLATSTLVLQNDTITGQVGHIGLAADGNDYFKFYAGNNTSISFNLAGNNTSGSAGSDFWMYVMNKAGAVLTTRTHINKPIGAFADVFTLPCVTADTLVIRFAASGCFSYSLQFAVTNITPTAAILSSRLGNSVGYTANTTNTQSILWDFDDGTTSTFAYPKKDFPIGSYNVKLTGYNTTCNLVAQDSQLVVVKGIEYYEPLFAGAGGDAVIHIYGGGLDTATKVSLTLNGSTLVPFEKYANDKNNMLTANFDLHFADEGEYDVTIEIPGEPAVVFPKGFRINAFEYPFSVAQVIGPDRWRTNRDTRFVLAVTNRGNVTASGVLVNLAFPKSVTLKFEHSAYQPDSTGFTTITTEDTTVTLANSEVMSAYKDMDPFTPIDFYRGEPFDGYYVRLLLPHVPANSTFELPFLARSTSTGSPKFIVSTQKPNLYGSCETPNYVQVSDGVAGEMLDAVDLYADNTKNVPLKVFTVGTKIGKEHLALSARQAGDHFWAWWDGYEVQPETYALRDKELTAANDYMVKTATTEGLKLVAGKGQKFLNDKYAERVDFINKRLANNPKLSAELTDKYLDKLGNLTATNDRLNALFKNTSDLVTLYEKLIKLEAELENCPELQKQIDDLKKELDKELTPREEKEKETQTVVSMDPNAIYGPAGVGTPGWINTLDLVTYMVTYENMDTALADAQIVRVYDTLNPAVFDLSSFRFGGINIGNRALRIPTARQEFVYDLDLRPEKDIIVRILGNLDTVSGLITWSFVSLDPITMDLPVFDGFLPPNVNAPEGEGTMTYSVKLRADLPNQTAASNVATIYFDDNDPILTNVWINTLDKGLPTSSMSATLEGNKIKINFNSTDAESGVDVNFLYVKQSTDTNWVAITSTPYDTMTFNGAPGVTYQFYSTAIDKLGQEEVKTPQVEVTVTVPGNTESTFDPSFSLYPNPANNVFYARPNGNFADVEVVIYSITGQAVFKSTEDFTAGTDREIKLPTLRQGAYLVHFTNKAGKTNVQKLLIVKMN